MGKITILFADNNPNFLKTRTEFLEKEGYRVVSATNPTEARRVLERGDIDLAILDIRLLNDDDEKDLSGITLAKETDPIIPKILLTSFPSVKTVRESLRVQLIGLPAAVEYVYKGDGPEALLRAIRNVLSHGRDWLNTVKAALSGIDNTLHEDYVNAQKQAQTYYWVSLVMALTGAVFIFIGIALVIAERIDYLIVSIIPGIITEVIGFLFFRRADKANNRMDRYHKERIESQRFEMLLDACDGLHPEQQQSQGRQDLILTASKAWLGEARFHNAE
ncbi:MAG: response regulator [Anaerolineales bacterium]